VVGWGENELAVDFAWDGLYDAVDFLVDAPLLPELSSGMSGGEPWIISDMGRVAIAVGRALTTAAQLALLARPGEVLLDPQLVEQAEGSLGVLGEAGIRPGRPEVPALILDPENPLVDASEGGRAMDPSFGPPPSEATRKPSSSHAPPSVVAKQVERLADTTAALEDTEGSVFPPEFASALKKRDADSLHELAETVKSHGAHAAERIEAMAQLASGRSGEALRRLRRSKDEAQDQDPTTRCRAALALGVALASAGRPYEAALEGLDAIARAREATDQRGERACARFLSQLSQTLGDTPSAEAWAQLGK
jgi:class 3 adenylate cyclase